MDNLWVQKYTGKYTERAIPLSEARAMYMAEDEMGCEVIKDKDGNRLTVCFRGRRTKPKCVVCTKPAVALCDHELGLDDLRLAGQDTCSAGLCGKHRIRGAGDTDYCPNHKDSAAQLSLFG